ncbi:MAG: dTDP-4-dehydrorhamnose reductase [Flavobacteriaceae bacterium]
MKKILVTGAQGQLGQCIRDAALEFSELEILFEGKEFLDLTNSQQVTQFFETHAIDYCINAAAYTHVDKAENERDLAFAINGEAVKNLAVTCAKHETVLIHVSTDYVFDGKKETPYTESDPTYPINVYGASKLEGEAYIRHCCPHHFIVRTSWLYSQYGHNFLKTILRLAQEKNQLTMTTDQIGGPTNANDLANVLLQLIAQNSTAYGTYHFSNEGAVTWYDFAKAILEISGFSEKVTVAKTNNYPTFAERPKNSVLSNDKLNKLLGISSKNWKESLETLIQTKW